MTQKASNEQSSSDLIARVLSGDAAARRELTHQTDPLVQFQTDRFCRRYCQYNKYSSQCTLTPPEGPKADDAPLCDWANASYSWMLNDLTSKQRLQTFEGKADTPFLHYIRVVVNSLPFYERWKDWRFGRRVYVPEFITELDPQAKKVFLYLRSGEQPELIAAKLSLPETAVKELAEKIIVTLVARKKLHLLNPPLTQNFSEISPEEDHAFEVEDDQPNQEQWLASVEMQQAFAQLDVVEQYVLEAMVIEEQEADDVLDALARLNISLKKGVSPANTNKQQLYYFKRKSLSKLHDLIQNQ
jgi:hypothetical protein